MTLEYIFIYQKKLVRDYKNGSNKFEFIVQLVNSHYIIIKYSLSNNYITLLSASVNRIDLWILFNQSIIIRPGHH